MTGTSAARSTRCCSISPIRSWSARPWKALTELAHADHLERAGVARSVNGRSVDELRASAARLAREFEAAHGLEEGRIRFEIQIETTQAVLGADGRAYRRLMDPLVRSGEALVDSLLSPLSMPPQAPVGLARYGRVGIRSATGC